MRVIRGLLCAAFVAVASCSRDASGAAGAAGGLSDADLADEIAQRIDVRENPTVFSLFVLLNAAGYDDETSAAMHPVRRAVRTLLPRRLADSTFDRLGAFYTSHAGGADLGAYTVVAMATSGPPTFTPARVWTDSLAKLPRFRALTELPALLRALHRVFPVDSVYRTQQLAYKAYITDYTIVMRREVAAAFRYARVRTREELAGVGERRRVVAIPNLLMSFERSYSFALDTTHYTVEGPQAVVGFNPYEFIRAVTAPLSYDAAHYAAVQKRAAAAYTGVQRLSAMDRFATLAAYVDECLVRAIALRYRGVRDEAHRDALFAGAVSDARTGLVLVPYFFERLVKYEDQSDPLRVYYPKLFDGLDGARELARWRDSIPK